MKIIGDCGNTDCLWCAERNYRAEGFTDEDIDRLLSGDITVEELHRELQIEAALQDVEDLFRMF